MRRICLMSLVGLFWFCLLPVEASAHCEIPCGIYDDEARIAMIGVPISTSSFAGL